MPYNNSPRKSIRLTLGPQGPPIEGYLFRLQSPSLVAMGNWETKYPARQRGVSWLGVEPNLTELQWASVLDLGMRPTGLSIMTVLGLQIEDKRLHAPILRLIAKRLPSSRVVALNIGEMDVSAATFEALMAAIAHEKCILGHIYLGEVTKRQKKRLREQLRVNRRKAGYHRQLARPEVFVLKGANCWFNFGKLAHARALAHMAPVA